MPAPYSIDLRSKVISAIDNGMGKTEASRVFQMSRNTIDLWLKRRERENTLAPKVRQSQSLQAKIQDWNEFRDFVDAHPAWSQEQMGRELGVSASCVGRALKKIGYSRKKDSSDTKSAMGSNATSLWKPSTM
jgi:transposase